MSSKPSGPSQLPPREERLAKALRENLARRKALTRAKRDRIEAEAESGSPDPATQAQAQDGDDASS
jgi:hypothetical protein